MTHSRRRVLGFGVGALVGSTALASTGTRTGLAASVEAANDQVTVETAGDSLSELYISQLDLSLDWRGIDAADKSVSFDLGVRVGSGDRHSVATGSISLGGQAAGNGSVTQSGSAPTWDSLPWDAVEGVSSIDLLSTVDEAFTIAGSPYDVVFDLEFEHEDNGASASASTGIEVAVEAATPDTIIEQFDDMSSWNGSGKYYLDSNAVTAGANNLRVNTTNSGGKALYSFPGDGLSHYIQRGDVFEFDFEFNTNDSWQRFWFAVQDDNPEGNITSAQPNNGYVVSPDIYRNAFKIRKNTEKSDGESVSFSQGQTYTARVVFQSTITATLREYGATPDDTLAEVAITDSEWDAGGMWTGYSYSSTNGDYSMDHLRYG